MPVKSLFSVGKLSDAKRGDLFVHRTRSARRIYLNLVDDYDQNQPYAVLLHASDRPDWLPRDVRASRDIVGCNYGNLWEIELIEGPESFIENHDVIASAGTIHVDLEQKAWLSVSEREVSAIGDTFDIDLASCECRDQRNYASIPFSRWKIWALGADRRVDQPLFEIPLTPPNA